MSRARTIKSGTWQYHPRSDHHSKVACWGILFDLLLNSERLRAHAEAGHIAFGINHQLVDHSNARKKKLDLVLCRPPAGSWSSDTGTTTFADLATQFALDLTESDRHALNDLPALHQRPVASVLMALEAKAAMTAFGKARPRLYDELASSHSVIHGDTDSAIAVGFVLINSATNFISPTLNGGRERERERSFVVSTHSQPSELIATVNKIDQLPRRTALGQPGFDAIAAIAIDCTNDGETPVTIMDNPDRGAVPLQHPLHYDTMIGRTVGLYSTRFPNG